jgi:Ca2+:H+ antiporter
LLFNSIKKSSSFIVYILLFAVPIAIILNSFHSDKFIVFIVAGIALIPLAKLIGDSTEHLGSHYGATLGSLLNVTFGNAAEIIISISAINANLFTFVKASITGSILGNILLIFGLSIIAGGIKHKEQRFNKENTAIQSSMLFLAIIVLAVPTILALSATTLLHLKPEATAIEGNKELQFISDLLAIVLLAVYLAGLFFTFVTHKHLFITPSAAATATAVQYKEEGKKRKGIERIEKEFKEAVANKESSTLPPQLWTKKKSFVILTFSIIGVAIISEILVGSIETVTKEFGFGQVFVGAVIVGLIGNAAEHTSAIMLSVRNKLDLSIGIATGSGTQVALFVAPVLIISGLLIGKPFTLVFTLFEIVTLFLAAIILKWISYDGKSNWFEGVMLTAVYIVFAFGFFFVK